MDDKTYLDACIARDRGGSVMAKEHDEDVHYAEITGQTYRKGAVQEIIGEQYAYEDERDMWDEIGVHYASYDSHSMAVMINVLRGIARPSEGGEGLHGRDIAKRTGIPESLVTMMQYVICSGGRANYGTNPMGCWYESDEPFGEYLQAWRENYMRDWCKVPPDFFAEPLKEVQ